jgi:hypothetical protein
MNNEKLKDLGRRATACKHWRWMDGMSLCDTTGRVAGMDQ